MGQKWPNTFDLPIYKWGSLLQGDSIHLSKLVLIKAETCEKQISETSSNIRLKKRKAMNCCHQWNTYWQHSDISRELLSYFLFICSVQQIHKLEYAWWRNIFLLQYRSCIKYKFATIIFGVNVWINISWKENIVFWSLLVKAKWIGHGFANLCLIINCTFTNSTCSYFWSVSA